MLKISGQRRNTENAFFFCFCFSGFRVLCGVHKVSATLQIPDHSDHVRYEEKNLDSVESLEKGLIANHVPVSIAVKVITCIYARG